MSTADSKRCSKRSCNKILEEDPTAGKKSFSQCSGCREQNRRHQAARRKRSRTDAGIESGDENRPPNGAKRVQANVEEHAQTCRVPFQAIRNHALGNALDPTTSTSPDIVGNEALATRKPSPLQEFSDSKDTYRALTSLFQNHIKNRLPLEFAGSYTVPADSLTTNKQQVQNVAFIIWSVTGYRWIVHDNASAKCSHTTRYWCSQDEDHAKAAKHKEISEAKNRDGNRMRRWPCGSRMTVTCSESGDRVKVVVRLAHKQPHYDQKGKHTPYKDVTMPGGAIAIIRENLEWSTPSALVMQVQSLFRSVTAKQIHHAWRQMSEEIWKRDDDQITSAQRLLKELEENGSDKTQLFDLASEVPEGVEILAFVFPSVIEGLQVEGERIEEIGLDATYGTNDKHLELYSIVAEHDNTGFPLSYCLLSTASSLEMKKRTKALEAWTRKLRDSYGLNPSFVHVDKDMAEVGCIRSVWPETKIQLCWWHLRKAIRERLAKNKLSTTPYDPLLARQEFSFIRLDFKPQGRADKGEWEGGMDGYADRLVVPNILTQEHGPNSLLVKLPPPSQPQSTQPFATQPSLSRCVRLIVKPPGGLSTETVPQEASNVGTHCDRSPNDNAGPMDGDAAAVAGRNGRIFCPDHYRKEIEEMIERHFCAHPFIPGYCHPSPEGIRAWAVKKMYEFCEGNDLPEVWAYMYGNWYRKGWWGLWARSAYDEIPVLKTTMMVESHWRKIKHDFLHHFHRPRIDLLCWILVQKLMPCYYRKLDNMFAPSARFREPPAWRKDFKNEWKRCARASIGDPEDLAYAPNAYTMLQQPVPSIFFQEVRRHRTPPIWRHSSLLPLHPPPQNDTLEDPEVSTTQQRPLQPHQLQAAVDSSGEEIDPFADARDEGRIGRESEDEEDDVEMGCAGIRSLPSEKLSEIATLCEDFARAIRYQTEFNDPRFLAQLLRSGRPFFHLAEACLAHEKQANSTRSPNPRTWSQNSSLTMFYRSRPRSLLSATPSPSPSPPPTLTPPAALDFNFEDITNPIRLSAVEEGHPEQRFIPGTPSPTTTSSST